MACLPEMHPYFINLQLSGPNLPRSYIRKQFHPRTRLPDRIISLDDSPVDDSDPIQAAENNAQVYGDNDLQPWAPYPSYADFLFASRMISTCASDNDINFFLRNMSNGVFCESGSSKLSFQNAAQLRKVTDTALKLYATFEEVPIAVQYINSAGKKMEHKYPMWVKNGMAMTREMVKDPGLKDQWIWYAEKQSMVVDSEDKGEFITHPMSGEAAWEAEGQLNPGVEQVQFPYILYSDKSNAARFSNVAIWPLCIRIVDFTYCTNHARRSLPRPEDRIARIVSKCR
ncbi:hypothetical protein FRB91_005278 [Serendipita sp. 411]|nr:hypothetical protein FRB91_005278 [Serendipita sp. 411]